MILVFDTSGSMLATDVAPSRLAAAQLAGVTFAEKIPDTFRVGVIGFGSSAQQLVEPTTDHARVKATISSLQVKGATAMGDALKLAIDSARIPAPDGLGGSRRLPAAIVLLGDGASTRGSDPIDIVQDTKKYKIPVYTVALGTQDGTLTHTNPTTGVTNTEPVPPDLLTLQDIARDTGGQFFATADARRLQAVYANLSTRLTKTQEKRQVTSAFAGGALVLLLARGRLRPGPRREARREARPDRARALAVQARARGRPARGPALARPRGDEADREPAARRAPDAAGRLRNRAGDDPAVLPG